MERDALEENLRLSTEPEVINNIVNYVESNKFPWE
jgi:hypothetical protein